MRCHSCSNPLPDSSKFCGTCGVSTDPADAPTRDSAYGDRPCDSPFGVPDSPLSVSDPLSGSRFLPGTLLAGRYRIVGQIGRGGMGEVCRADDLKLGQPVALKFLPESLEREGKRLSRFLNEVKVARQVAHPNVCRVYDVAEVDGHHFISMEYVDGEDLKSLLRRIGRLPSDKAVEIARQLCAGLAAAHEKGILHRDLKPANVMIDGQGQVRITDFGLAGLAGEITGPEICAGTPDYMSPEQIDGKGVSMQSDLYSLGHVLYELFTGKRAFRADSLAELARLQREATPTSPSSLVEGLEPAVERVVLRCLEKDARDRPQSAIAVAAALPGGDPLAAALAAGETPSPEMIAAAGPEGGLRPKVALTCMAAVSIGVVVVGMALGRSTLYGHVPFEQPVQVLEARAREIARDFGYEEPPVDAWSEIVVHQPALDYFARLDATASRWEPLRSPGQIAMFLAYRQADRSLSPLGLAGEVGYRDPPLAPGDLQLSVGLEERLLYFLATPPFVDHAGRPPKQMDWSVVFDAAGLEMGAFEEIPPTIQPQAYADTRAAWKGVLPHRDDLPVRVEAAALDGKIVYFETVTPYDRYWSGETEHRATAVPVSQRLVQAGGVTLLLLVTAGALFLARRNWRLGRGDRKGAARLALYVLALRMLHWLLTGHHVLDFQAEFNQALVAIGGGLILAALTWVLYFAIEPYLRRLWPESLVSWTRLLAGRFRDPLVGRDVLIGFMFGIGLTLAINLAQLAPAWLGLPPRSPLPWGIGALAGGREAIGQLFGANLASLPGPLAYILMFLLLRMLLRRPWLAGAAFAAILAAFGALQFAPSGTNEVSVGLVAIGALLGAVEAAVLLLLMLRFGVLSLVGCFLLVQLMVVYPITFDASSPYFATTIFAILVTLAISAYAFYVSLAGRPLFHDAILHEPA